MPNFDDLFTGITKNTRKTLGVSASLINAEGIVTPCDVILTRNTEQKPEDFKQKLRQPLTLLNIPLFITPQRGDSFFLPNKWYEVDAIASSDAIEHKVIVREKKGRAFSNGFSAGFG